MEYLHLRASFGSLQDRELTLKPGLNLIEAPNESGKSTWAGFLRAMLYGVNTSERSKNGSLPDKRRYLPWSGAPMSGVLTLRWQGRDITLSRNAPGAGKPMGAVTALYSGTNEKIPALMSGVAGETLTGVTEPVFRRSAFISGADMAVDASSELEKRITALVTSGEEGSSYREADERLRRWQRKRRWRASSGRLNEAEAELGQVRDALGRIEAENSRLTGLRTEQDKLETQQALLELELRRHRRDQLAAQRQKLTQARRDAAEAGARLAGLEARTNGLTAEKLSALSAAAVRLEEAARDLDEATARQKEAAAARDALPDPAAALPSRKKPWIVLLFILGVALLLLGGAAGTLRLPLPVGAVYGGMAAGLVSLAAACWVLSAKRREDRALRAARQQELALAEQRLEDLTARRTAAEQETEACRTAQAEALVALGRGADASPVAAVREAEALLRDLQAARLASASADALAGALADTTDPEQEPDPVEGPTRLSLTEAEDYQARTRQRLREVRRELDRGEGGYAALGDPLVLSTREARLEAEIWQLEAEYEALDLAIDALREANLQLQTLFSPLVSRRAAALLGQMTDGAYSGVYFDRDMRFSAQRQGDAAVHPLEYLSDGARNQLYLSVRLAICQLALPEEDPCPLILDDVLATFDDARARQTLGLLRELAKTRQIILFTCQSREARLLAELEEAEQACPQP